MCLLDNIALGLRWHRTTWSECMAEEGQVPHSNQKEKGEGGAKIMISNSRTQSQWPNFLLLDLRYERFQHFQ
jgi:hypothetical protein